MNNKIAKVLKKEKGTTLVEVMLSVALMAIIITPLLGTVWAAVQNNTAAKEKTEAIALAEKVMGEIKAQKVIVEEPGAYLTSGGGKLLPYYEIKLEDEGSISLNESDTYDISDADNPDFELVIDQGTTTDQKVSSVKLINCSDTDDTTELTDLPVADTILMLKVEKDESGYSYFFGKKSDTGSSKSFTPKNTDNPKIIKLKVTYAGDTLPSSYEQLNIFTYIDSDAGDIFKVYVINNEEINSGVNFINKETANDFEVTYMDTHVFNINEPLNKLFKVTVTIKKNVRENGKEAFKEIYKTSSYVKK